MAAQQVSIEVEGMKLEIDIDEDYYKIICKRVEENKPYHSSYEYEVIANGKPLEQELFINKPCVSTKICEHDKNVVLNKIRAQISTVYESLDGYDPNSLGIFESRVNELIDNLLSEQGE